MKATGARPSAVLPVQPGHLQDTELELVVPPRGTLGLYRTPHAESTRSQHCCLPVLARPHSAPPTQGSFKIETPPPRGRKRPQGSGTKHLISEARPGPLNIRSRLSLFPTRRC